MSKKQPPWGLIAIIGKALILASHRQGKHAEPRVYCVLCWFEA